MKDKIYYFQEKSNDILDLQDELTIEEIGMYFILKAAYFKNFGELTENNLVQRCRFFGDKEKLMELARKLFEFKEGNLVNNSWLSQIKGIKEKSDERKKAANIRWQKDQEVKDHKPKKPKKTQDNPPKPNGLLVNIEDQFEEFWNLYNYKKGKPKALAAYKICIKKTTHQQILEGVKKYNETKGTESKYWKHPTTWLNAESWNDEYSTESKTPEVKSQKQIWTEKILKSPKPADYEEVIKIANFEADYKYFENDKFYFLAENDEIKTKCKQRVKEIELELFKLKNNQSQVLIISKNYFDGK